MNQDSLFSLAIVLVIALIAIVASVYQSRRRKEMLTRQAEKRNGELAKSGFLRRWELRLPYKGNTVIISSVPGSRYSPPKTIAAMKDDTARLSTIEIMRNDIGQKIMEKFGKERILTNDEEFDKQYAVRGEDPFLAQRLLTAELRPKLLEYSGMRSLQIKITPQEMCVTMFSIPSNDETYDNFIDTVFSILQKVL
jgi:hypothetical protein